MKKNIIYLFFMMFAIFSLIACSDLQGSDPCRELGHDIIIVDGVEATCTTPGLTEGSYCSRCDYKVEQVEVPVKEHSYGEWTIVLEPTEFETGLQEKKCNTCNHIITEVIQKLDHTHNYKTTVVKATCEEQGYTTHICEKCDHTYVDSYVEALGHDMVIDEAVDPTCTQTGLTEGSHCSRCEHVIPQEEISALGHAYKEVVTNPTCEEEGYITHTCERCNDTYVDSYVEALGHDMIVDEAVDPTCTQTGLTEGSHCSRCEHVIPQEEVEALGHAYKEVVTNPTCEEEGYTTHTCERCNDTYVDSYVEALGHDMVIDEAVDPTCTQTGLTEGSHCSRCEHVIPQEEVEALGHAYKEVVTNPTCEDEGYTTHTCERCNDTYVDSYVEALDHNFESVIIEPTCTEQGYTTHTCSCGYSYVDTYVNEVDHTYGEWTTTKEPACEEAGTKERVCSCGVKETESIAALGHQYGDYYSNDDATCSEDGTKSATCKRCDEISTIVDENTATGHRMLNILETNDCPKKDVYVYTCMYCDYAYEEEIEDIEISVLDVYTNVHSYSYTDGSELHYVYVDLDISATGGAGTLYFTYTLYKNGTSIQTVSSTTSTSVRFSPNKQTSHNWDHYTFKITVKDATNRTTVFNYKLTPLKLISVENSKKHISSEWIEVVKPTCTSGGENHKVCTECHDILNIKTLNNYHNLENMTCDCGMNISDNFILSTDLSKEQNKKIIGYVTNINGSNELYIFGTGEMKDFTKETAIYKNYNISKIYISPKITSIGSYLLYNCKSLTNIDISKNVKHIGLSAFEGCTTLFSVYYSGTLLEWCGIQFDNIYSNPKYYATHLYMKERNQFYRVEEVELPNTLIEIKDYTFLKFSGISSIDPLDNLVKIGKGSFYGCTYLNEINFGNNIIEIGNDAFYGCANLKSVNVANIDSWCNIVFGNVYSNPLYYACDLYVDNVKVEEVIIPEEITVINDYAFYNCYGLTSVLLHDDIYSIGKNAFYNCNSLDSISIPDNVSLIGYDAFYGCDNIKDAKLPAYAIEFISKISLTDVEITSGDTIPSSAFKNCKTLKTVILADSVKTIGESAFYGSTYLNEINFGNNIIEIGNDAFYGCANLKSVNVANIDSWCNIVFGNVYSNPLYYACDLYVDNVKVEEVIIPEEINVINDYAFYNCYGLTSVLLHDDIYSIGKNAFYNCSSLDSISIPDNVSLIEYDAFYGCDNIKEAKLPAHAIEFISKISLTDVEITSGDTIPRSAFENCKTLKTVILADSVKTIGVSAFYGCSMLSDIKMSNKLNIISDRSFYGCSSLIEINIPASVQIIDGYYDIGFSGSGGAFAYCSNLKYVIFAENSILNEIGEHAFYNCKSIKSIILPKSVALIKHGAFSGCSSLEEISLPVVTVNEYDGSRTRNYSFGRIFGSKQYEGGVEIKQNYYTNYNYYGWSEFTCYVPQTLSRVIVTGGYIQDSNFKNCTMIEEVIIHKGVTIGSDPFEHCINVNVYCEKNGSGNLKWSTNYGTYENKTTWNYNNVTSNSEYDYIIRDSGVYLIKYKGTEINVVVPDVIDGYKVVGMDNLFASRSDVTSVVLPNSLYSIDDYSFANCSNLQSIYIPSSVTSIGKYAFSGCSSLVSIILPESVLFIDDYSFEECSSLENIVIPNSVTKIGYKLFEGCDALKYTEYSNGYYLGNEDNKYVILIKTISNSVTECTIHENTKFIYNNAFYNCRSITNITIPESVTSIGQSAFYNCSSLQYIVIPENVIYIGYGAFAECDNLTIYSEIFYAACGWSNNWNYLEYSYGNKKYISVYWRGNWKYVDGVPTPIK